MFHCTAIAPMIHFKNCELVEITFPQKTKCGTFWVIKGQYSSILGVMVPLSCTSVLCYPVVTYGVNLNITSYLHRTALNC